MTTIQRDEEQLNDLLEKANQVFLEHGIVISGGNNMVGGSVLQLCEYFLTELNKREDAARSFGYGRAWDEVMEVVYKFSPEAAVTILEERHQHYAQLHPKSKKEEE